MATETQQATIKIRRDTAANWTSNDPTPNEGEWCMETDTKITKIGDGTTAWSSLDDYIDPKAKCTAWVNFNGTGTVAIRDSFNVSSITDNGGSGDYTINFATPMDNANYCAVVGSKDNNAIDREGVQDFTTNGFRVLFTQTGVSTQDTEIACIVIFGGKS